METLHSYLNAMHIMENNKCVRYMRDVSESSQNPKQTLERFSTWKHRQYFTISCSLVDTCMRSFRLSDNWFRGTDDDFQNTL